MNIRLAQFLAIIYITSKINFKEKQQKFYWPNFG